MVFVRDGRRGRWSARPPSGRGVGGADTGGARVQAAASATRCRWWSAGSPYSPQALIGAGAGVGGAGRDRAAGRAAGRTSASRTRRTGVRSSATCCGRRSSWPSLATGDEHVHRAGGGGDRVRVAQPGGRRRPGRGVRPGRWHVRRRGAAARGRRLRGCSGRRRASSTWAGSTSTRRCSGTSWRRSASDVGVARRRRTRPRRRRSRGCGATASRPRRRCRPTPRPSIPVDLPGVNTSVRLTRGEFEDMMRPTLAETVAAIRRVLRSCGPAAGGRVGDRAGRRLVADPAGQRAAVRRVRPAGGARHAPQARRRARRGDPRARRRRAGSRRRRRRDGQAGGRRPCPRHPLPTPPPAWAGAGRPASRLRWPAAVTRAVRPASGPARPGWSGRTSTEPGPGPPGPPTEPAVARLAPARDRRPRPDPDRGATPRPPAASAGRLRRWPAAR